jgi:hypothetical protein
LAILLQSFLIGIQGFLRGMIYSGLTAVSETGTDLSKCTHFRFLQLTDMSETCESSSCSQFRLLRFSIQNNSIKLININKYLIFQFLYKTKLNL